MFKFLKIASYVLVIIGGLNWGFVGLFDFDLIAFIFGYMSALTRLIYILVGLSAVISAITAYLYCRSKEDV